MIITMGLIFLSHLWEYVLELYHNICFTLKDFFFIDPAPKYEMTDILNTETQFFLNLYEVMSQYTHHKLKVSLSQKRI